MPSFDYTLSRRSPPPLAPVSPPSFKGDGTRYIAGQTLVEFQPEDPLLFHSQLSFLRNSVSSLSFFLSSQGLFNAKRSHSAPTSVWWPVSSSSFSSLSQFFSFSWRKIWTEAVIWEGEREGRFGWVLYLFDRDLEVIRRCIRGICIYLGKRRSWIGECNFRG